jgi:segregation and condensation protein B
MSLTKTVESLLFVATRPLSAKKLGEISGAETAAVEEALAELARTYDGRGGLVLVRSGQDWQLATSPDSAAVVQEYLKDEMTGELTRPSLEALTVIAYRGPVTKAEIEQIRGVNCTLIIRNLMMRGLVEAEEDRKSLLTRYRVSLNFLRFLGVAKVEDLPDYAALNADRTLAELLAATAPAPAAGPEERKL